MDKKLSGSVPVLGDDGKVVAYVPESFANKADLDCIVTDENEDGAKDSGEAEADSAKPGTTELP